MDGEADRGRGARKPPNENDVLAHMDFPAAHRVKRHATNGLERLSKEVKRRADVVGVRRCARTDDACASRPNEASIMRLVGAVLMEANDEWQLQHRYLSIEAFAGVSVIEEEADRFALASPAATPILTSRAA